MRHSYLALIIFLALSFFAGVLLFTKIQETQNNEQSALFQKQQALISESTFTDEDREIHKLIDKITK